MKIKEMENNSFGTGVGLSLAGLFISTGIVINGFITSRAIEKNNPLNFITAQPFEFSMKVQEDQNGGVRFKGEYNEFIYNGGMRRDYYDEEVEIYGKLALKENP